MSSLIPTSASSPGDNNYSYTIARLQQPQPDLTPSSAVCSPDQHSISLSDFFDTDSESDPMDQVSSFNLPGQADHNLFTPTSMTNSPSIPMKTSTTMDIGVHIKHSPSSEMSPASPFDIFDHEDCSPRDNGPMKPKSYSGQHRLPMGSNSMGPESPGYYASPPPPYYGAFGVSAPPKLSTSPSSSHTSPRMQPAIQSRSNIQDYRGSSAHHNSAYKSSAPLPVLIAPNPSNRRPALPSYRHNSLPSNKSPPLRSIQSTVFSHNDPPKGKKGQKKAEPSYHDYCIIKSTPELYEELNDQELFILDLRYEKGLQWKEVAKVYTQKHTKKTQVAALQMRRTRLMERLATRAYEIASCNPDTVKWTAICTQLQRYLNRKPSKDAMQGQKKWDVNSPYGSYYDVQEPKRERTASDLTIESFEHDSWSDGRESTGHSLHDSDPGGLLSAISSATMDDARSRAASDASLQLQLQRQQEHQRQQHQSLLYAQQQHQGWGQRQNSN